MFARSASRLPADTGPTAPPIMGKARQLEWMEERKEERKEKEEREKGEKRKPERRRDVGGARRWRHHRKSDACRIASRRAKT